MSEQVALDRLPREVLQTIASHMTRPTILQCNAVSKTLRDIVLPILFSEISFVFGDTVAFDSAFKVINPAHWKHVKSVKFVIDESVINGVYPQDHWPVLTNYWRIFNQMTNGFKVEFLSKLLPFVFNYRFWDFWHTKGGNAMTEFLSIHRMKSQTCQDSEGIQALLNFSLNELERGSPVWEIVVPMILVGHRTVLQIQIAEDDDDDDDEPGQDQEALTENGVNLSLTFPISACRAVHLQASPRLFAATMPGSTNLTRLSSTIYTESDWGRLSRLLERTSSSLRFLHLRIWAKMPVTTPSMTAFHMKALTSVSCTRREDACHTALFGFLDTIVCPTLRELRLHGWSAKGLGLIFDATDGSQDESHFSDFVKLYRPTIILTYFFGSLMQSDIDAMREWSAFASRMALQTYGVRCDAIVQVYCVQSRGRALSPADFRSWVPSSIPFAMRPNITEMQIDVCGSDTMFWPTCPTPIVALPRVRKLRLQLFGRPLNDSPIVAFILGRLQADNLSIFEIVVLGSQRESTDFDRTMDCITGYLSNFPDLTNVRVDHSPFMASTKSANFKNHCSRLGIEVESFIQGIEVESFIQ